MAPLRGMYTPSNIGHTSRALSLQTASSPTPVKGESKASPVSFKADTITNPDELTSFVETLLKDLEEKFDNMSMQVLDKMDNMSSRIDSLELSLGDFLNTNDIGISRPGTPSGGSLILRQ